MGKKGKMLLQKITLIIASLFVFHFIFNIETHASDKFGVLYDIQGKVQMKSTEGKAKNLNRERDLLHAVNEGDKIKVLGKGRAVIVSLIEEKGYEIESDSEALIKNKKVITVKGNVKTLEGLNVPNEDVNKMGGKPIGAVVLRGVESCIKIISPVNTSILELSPELKWKNECQKSKKVFIAVLLEGNKIFNSQTENESLRIPDSILKYGTEYTWVIDGGAMNGLASGRFAIPDENQIKTMKEKIAYYKGQGNDLPQRHSYLFFLLNNNLNEMAKDEIEKLKSGDNTQ